MFWKQLPQPWIEMRRLPRVDLYPAHSAAERHAVVAQLLNRSA